MPQLKPWLFLAVIWLLQSNLWAQAPVVMTIDTSVRGPIIPDDFIGLSIETSNLLPDKDGNHLFSADNRTLVNYFRNIGIKHLRVGGGTVDIPRYAVPGQADIDNLFAFAQAAGVKVIYSFRLINGNATNTAALAGHIWQHYQSQLGSFSIGNEPDWRSYHKLDPRITDYPSYLADWRYFADAIRAAAPGAKFSGPDTGSNFPVPGATNTFFDGQSWTERFARDVKNSGLLALVLQHDYVGENARGVGVHSAADAMLSADWVSVNYPALHDQVLGHVADLGLPYRMTECNDYVGGVKGASDAFASALWALDYMHWWAAHGCAGVNFHNRRGTLTDTIYWDSPGHFWIGPKAYGLKAFDLGSRGCALTSITWSNPAAANVTGYAVGDSTNLTVTIINKTHGYPGGTNILVTLRPKHFAAATGKYIILASDPPGDCVAAGATLGGSQISADTAGTEQWTPLTVNGNGECALYVAAASAIVVQLRQTENLDRNEAPK